MAGPDSNGAPPALPRQVLPRPLESHPLPAPVRRLLSLLPAAPGSRLFATALNLALLRHLSGDAGAALRFKRLRMAPPDLSISASLHDFAQPAARREDRDALFFSCRLLMEGDRAGLMVESTLDAIDGPVFDPAWLAPRRMLASVATRRPR